MKSLARLLALASITFAGCASIPLSTMLKLSSLTPQELAMVDPAQVRVRLSAPVGFAADIPGSRLTLSLSNASRTHSGMMALELVSADHGERPGGLFGPDIPVTTYLLKLDKEGVLALRGVQAFVRSEDPNKLEFSFKTAFSRMPPEAENVTFWVDLRFSLAEPFMPLIDGAEISFERD